MNDCQIRQAVFLLVYIYFKLKWNLFLDLYLYLTSIHYANSSKIIPGEGTRIE